MSDYRIVEKGRNNYVVQDLRIELVGYLGLPELKWMTIKECKTLKEARKYKRKFECASGRVIE